MFNFITCAEAKALCKKSREEQIRVAMEEKLRKEHENASKLLERIMNAAKEGVSSIIIGEDLISQDIKRALIGKGFSVGDRTGGIVCISWWA